MRHRITASDFNLQQICFLTDLHIKAKFLQARQLDFAAKLIVKFFDIDICTKSTDLTRQSRRDVSQMTCGRFSLSHPVSAQLAGNTSSCVQGWFDVARTYSCFVRLIGRVTKFFAIPG